MLKPLELTPVHGDFGRVQGACAGRAEGLAKPPIPHLALLLPPPCCPPARWTLLGGPVPF